VDLDGLHLAERSQPGVPALAEGLGVEARLRLLPVGEVDAGLDPRPAGRPLEEVLAAEAVGERLRGGLGAQAAGLDRAEQQLLGAPRLRAQRLGRPRALGQGVDRIGNAARAAPVPGQPRQAADRAIRERQEGRP